MARVGGGRTLGPSFPQGSRADWNSCQQKVGSERAALYSHPQPSERTSFLACGLVEASRSSAKWGLLATQPRRQAHSKGRVVVSCMAV